MKEIEIKNSFNIYEMNSLVKQEASVNIDDTPIENESSSEVIDDSAVNLSLSLQSIKAYLNINSEEFTKSNISSQNSLLNIINNNEIYDFLSGKEDEDGFDLSSLGYEGKAITELDSSEATELISDDGFFGVTQTSNRVSSYVISLAGDDMEALKEVREGVEKGFEEAEKMWGGKLPDISYETQEKTLALIDEKISQLTTN